MRDELEIYEKLKDTVIDYLYEYLKQGSCREVKRLRLKIKTLCWVLDRMDLYEEMPKNRIEVLILQRRLKNLFGIE